MLHINNKIQFDAHHVSAMEAEGTLISSFGVIRYEHNVCLYT